ncbi:hypothetical protein J3A72_000422 [Stenotrophomonas sp. PvP093]|uniref:LPD7 domain-containing protein n=1 Tax=unclassified Stenotrophomonas TaxID=196198 RepID=UPI001AEB6A21|nr:LPD7 domain-containing protein [Stenotrophomonas sp. PvP093]MBP2480130.1 hypothetical protein [Stenotrophomonas sp. PvP093]
MSNLQNEHGGNSPLHSLSKAQVAQLARLVQRSEAAAAATLKHRATVKEQRFVVSSAMSPAKTTAAVKLIEAAEKALSKASLEDEKVGKALEKNPILKERFSQYQELVKAAAGNHPDAKALLKEVTTDFTIATAKDGKAKADPLREVAAAALVNGISAVGLPVAAQVAAGPHAAAVAPVTQAVGQAAQTASSSAQIEAQEKKAAKGKDEESDSADKPSAAGERQRKEPNELQQPGPRFPQHLLNRYQISGSEVKDKRTDAVVFVDKGNELKAPLAVDQEAIKAMVDTAETRGWGAIKVNGTEQFKAAMWMEAASRGLEVTGYKPSPEEVSLAEANRKLNGKENSISQGPAKSSDTQKLNPAAEVVEKFTSARTQRDRQAASKQFPELAKAFAMQSVMDKALSQALGKNSPAYDLGMQAFREKVSDRLQNGEVLPSVEVRDRAQERAPQQSDGPVQ